MRAALERLCCLLPLSLVIAGCNGISEIDGERVVVVESYEVKVDAIDKFLSENFDPTARTRSISPHDYYNDAITIESGNGSFDPITCIVETSAWEKGIELHFYHCRDLISRTETSGPTGRLKLSPENTLNYPVGWGGTSLISISSTPLEGTSWSRRASSASRIIPSPRSRSTGRRFL